MLPRPREEIFNLSQHDHLNSHLHSLSPTTGKSDIPQIKGKKIKNSVTSINKIPINPRLPKPRKGVDYDSIVQQEGVLSDRYHYEIKQNSIIQQTKRKRRKSALSFMEGNATQKQKVLAFDQRLDDGGLRKGRNLRPTKTWTNPNKLKSKHFLSIHNQSVKSTPRTYLESRVVKKVEKKGVKLKECSLEDLRKLITKMIDVELEKKLSKNSKQMSNTKIIDKRKVKKQETLKKKGNDVLVLRIKQLKTMTNSLIPSSDTVEDSNYQTERKQHPLKNINLQTTQSLAILKNLVNMTFQQQLQPDQIGNTVEDVAACRIKKAWKNYRTQRIIQQYASLFQENDDNEKQNPYGIGDKFMSEEQPFSMNESESDLMNQRQNFETRFKSEDKKQDKRSKEFVERPNNIPSKRAQIKNLEDALKFIKQEIGVESPNTILHSLINGIQLERQPQEEIEDIENQESKKKDLPQIQLDLTNKLNLNMFDQDLVKSESHNQSLNHNGWEFVSGTKDLELISDGFEKREKSLIRRKEEEIATLDQRLKEKKISERQYKDEVKRIEVWTKHELSSLNRVKRSLQKGLNQAESIINKNKQFSQFQALQKNPGLRKCLSTQYIKHLKVQESQEEHIYEPHLKQPPKINIELSNSAELKRLKKKLDSANNREKSFPSDEEFFSEELKLVEEFKSEEDEEESPNKSMEDKLKNLDVDQKDDIFEFAFLDLCIEFCQEIYCDQDNMKIALDYISKSKKKAKVIKNRGIKTNLNTVKEYLRQLKAYINRTNRGVYEKIKDPLGPTAKQMLKYMHYSEQEFKEKEDYDISSTLVLVTSIFENFQNSILPGIEIEPYYSDEAKQKSRVKFLKDVIHIHNKAVFDCLNESLDLERPFGMWGAPFPWKTTSKFSPQLSIGDLQEKYAKAEEKVYQCCSFFCGLLVDKEDSLITPGSKISQEYLEQVKEDRLSRMLAADLLEGEERWLFYDDEETETLVEISQIIYEILVREAIGEIKILLLPFQML